MNQDALIQTFSAGQWLFEAGDAGDVAYLVEEGEVVIALKSDEGVRPLAVYGPGSLFGEMALIDQAPRSASALALTDCRLRLISREQISHRTEQADPLLRVFLSVLMGNLRKTLHQLEQRREGVTRATPPLRELLQEAADSAVRASASGSHAAQVLSSPQSAPTPRALQLDLSAVPRVQAVEAGAFKGALRALNLEQELGVAIRAGQLRLFYQPIMEINTERLAGFEALIRWIHPERGFISPGEFIPVAERSGLIVQMTRWIIGVACADLREMRERLLGHPTLSAHVLENLFVSVNFSSRDFLNQDLMAYVREVLASSALPPYSLKIEITESVLMSSPNEVREALNLCRAHGASVAIDDFGTGYSSLSYLQSMPADTLKIDQGFIRPMHTDERHMALVESIIHLARRLNMKTVAEGVETQEDVDSLTALQCDYLQGYHFARPMPPKDIIGWAERRWRSSAPSDEFLG
jgi:EAL domain-containing protein (putative c-di-GMP-specific phosphodiesterase class I)/CRP-like cAMP-binding protein